MNTRPSTLKWSKGGFLLIKWGKIIDGIYHWIDKFSKSKSGKACYASHFPKAIVRGVDVKSGVSDQPFGDEETRLGAINRALRGRNERRCNRNRTRRWRPNARGTDVSL